MSNHRQCCCVCDFDIIDKVSITFVDLQIGLSCCRKGLALSYRLYDTTVWNHTEYGLTKQVYNFLSSSSNVYGNTSQQSNCDPLDHPFTNLTEGIVSFYTGAQYTGLCRIGRVIVRWASTNVNGVFDSGVVDKAPGELIANTLTPTCPDTQGLTDIVTGSGGVIVGVTLL